SAADFKFILAHQGLINHPNWTGNQAANDLSRKIETALNSGYQVVAGPAFLQQEKACSESFVVFGKTQASHAILSMNATNYELTPLFDDPYGGKYSILTRRKNTPAVH